ncbi:MAG: hypothetical protein ACYTGV_03860 [Planctomycetota bacterium]
MISKKSLDTVKKTVGPMRRRFNRRLPSGQAVTVVGHDKEGRLIRLARFYFKPKKTQERTIEIKVTEFGDLEGSQRNPYLRTLWTG